MTQTSRRKKQPRATELHQPDLGPIEKVALDLLKPFEANAPTHDQRQLAKLAQSLQVFGWINPLLATGDGTIIAGHGRWLAAKKLGLTHAQVVRIEHLNDAQVRAYRIADNRLAELSGWDDELLALELGQLGELDLDFNIEVTGFDHSEIDVLLDKPERSEEGPRDYRR